MAHADSVPDHALADRVASTCKLFKMPTVSGGKGEKVVQFDVLQVQVWIPKHVLKHIVNISVDLIVNAWHNCVSFFLQG